MIHVGTAEVLYKLMPRFQVIIEGIGHMPMLEQPKQSVEDYLRFRKGVPGAVTEPAVTASN